MCLNMKTSGKQLAGVLLVLVLLLVASAYGYGQRPSNRGKYGSFLGFDVQGLSKLRNA